MMRRLANCNAMHILRSSVWKAPLFIMATFVKHVDTEAAQKLTEMLIKKLRLTKVS